MLGLGDGPDSIDNQRNLKNIETAFPFVYSPADNAFWYGDTFDPHECILIPFGVINKRLLTGFELKLRGTTGSVVIFGKSVELSGDEINKIYKEGKLPLDNNCNLLLPSIIGDLNSF